MVTSDRQLEVARRYRSDGSLEAERLRIRERTGYVSSDAEHPGCLVAWAQGLAGMLYIIAVPTLGYWLAGWPGAVFAFLLISIQVARHWG